MSIRTENRIEQMESNIAYAIANIRRAAESAQDGDYSIAMGDLMNAVRWLNGVCVYQAEIDLDERDDLDYKAIFKRAQEIEQERRKNED